MKKISMLLILAAVFNAAVVWAQAERNVSGFTNINVTGPMTVILTTGDTESLRIEADADDLDKIMTEVSDNTLNISAKNLKGKKDVVIYLTARELTSVSLTGSGKITGRSLIKSQSLTLNLAGSGDMSLDVGVNDLNLGLTGSGNLQLTGQAQDMRIRLTGSGDINALKLHAQKADIHVSGSGNARVNVQGDLTGSLNGSGDIIFMGTPTIKNVNVKGTGKLRPEGY